MIRPASKNSIFELPFALSMGPQRAGTSWLDRYLRQRGDICLPKGVKEVFYFDRHYERGTDFYASHFVQEPQHKIAMEISTTSFDNIDAPRRIHEIFSSDIKLICPLRNPITRSYSLYLHYLRYGLVQGSLQEAYAQNPQILESSRYAQTLERWFEYYGQDRITLLFQEDLENDSQAYLQKVCLALNIPYVEPLKKNMKRYNVSTYSGSARMAAMAQKGADWLRKNKFYFVINTAKAMGLKKIIFGKENPDAQNKEIPDDDRSWLEEKLGHEIENLEKLYGPIRQWA